MRDVHEHLHGTEILLELGSAPGLLLWLLLRDVELWAETPPSRRDGLFHGLDVFRSSESALPEAITAEVHALLAMLRRSTPGAGADACRSIAGWARRAAPGTALLYTQAAAALAPESAEIAHEVAAHAAACKQPLGAESWLRRAIALARRQRDWSTYAHAFADLGEIAESRQDADAARGAFERVLRVCRRHSLPPALRARALLAFMRAALLHGHPDSVSRLKRSVLRAVRPGDPAAPRTYLALGRALAGHGRHSEIVAFLHDSMPLHGTPEERFEIARLLVRSAAAVADSGARERAWEDAIALLQRAGGKAEFARLLARLADDLRDLAAEPDDGAGASGPVSDSPE
jgi:tetratricopeptide (TPR) repeat protein